MNTAQLRAELERVRAELSETKARLASALETIRVHDIAKRNDKPEAQPRGARR